MKALEHADYVFANEDECTAFAKAQGMPDGTKCADVAKKIASYKKVGKRPRTVILTHGAAPVIVGTSRADGEVDIKEYPIPPLAKDSIVDTNGAGDAFVGAFFAELYQGKDLEAAIKAGIYLSGEVVKRSGCTFPEKMNMEGAEPAKKVGYLNFSPVSPIVDMSFWLKFT